MTTQAKQLTLPLNLTGLFEGAHIDRTLKTCNVCGRRMPKIEFGLYKGSADGRYKTCRACRKNIRSMRLTGRTDL